MKTLLIINPVAGQGKPGSALAALEEEFPGIERHETTARGDAERLAREAVERGVERVLVAGGDGTVNEVANALAETDVSMGLIALGTGNVLARELGLPINDISASARVIEEGRTTRIDLGKANERYFLLMAGIGFDAEVCRQIAPKLKDALGAPAYVLTGLTTLAHYHPSHVLLELDDDRRITTSAYMVVVGNATSYAYQVRVTPLASMEDGLLDVCVFRERFSLGFLRQVAQVLTGRHLDHPHIRYHTVQKIYIEAHPPIAVQLDGDYFDETPIEITAVPRALSVIVPPSQQPS